MTNLSILKIKSLLFTVLLVKETLKIHKIMINVLHTEKQKPSKIEIFWYQEDKTKIDVQREIV